jgi:hypothetical protein
MGMFDTITCLYPDTGIDLDISKMQFQTKDLERALDHYTIDKDGQLWVEQYELQPSSTGRGLKKVNRRWEQSAYTGRINFYDYLEPRGWIEFTTVFSFGKLQQIQPAEYREPGDQPDESEANAPAPKR